jgi:hypothetical protein
MTTTKRSLFSRFSRRLGVFVTLLLLTIAVLQAQVKVSTVFGTITRRNNQPAPKVLVSVARKIAYTDDAGRYRIDGVPLGAQEMLVSSGGKVLLKVVVNVGSGAQRIDKTLP